MKDTLYMRLKVLRLAWWRFCRDCRNFWNCLPYLLGIIFCNDHDEPLE
jgi:hypothetical protein